MKKEHWILGAVAVAVLLYLTFPHFRGTYARLRSLLTRQSGYVVDGTAHSGNDSGGVLTNTDTYATGIS